MVYPQHEDEDEEEIKIKMVDRVNTSLASEGTDLYVVPGKMVIGTQ